MDFEWFLFLAGRIAVADAAVLIGYKTQLSSLYVQFQTYLAGWRFFSKNSKDLNRISTLAVLFPLLVSAVPSFAQDAHSAATEDHHSLYKNDLALIIPSGYSLF